MIIKLNPPIITPETILPIACVRPKRRNGFNISVMPHANQMIVHCYGHGGSGWTMLFGSVQRAITLFELTHPNKKDPIRIVGAGCMGLVSAIELHARGYSIAGITAKEPFDGASWRASGYFAFSGNASTSAESQLISELVTATFATYRIIEQGKHPYLNPTAVRLLPTYCKVGSDASLCGEYLSKTGCMPAGELVTLDFGTIQHDDFMRYYNYHIQTTNVMRQLMQEVARLGIPIEYRELQSFAQLHEPIIFNCSGLGAAELNSDKGMVPLRGHLIMLRQEVGYPALDYIVQTVVMQDGDDENLYLIPKHELVTNEYPDGLACAGVLGTTYAPTDGMSDEEIRELDAVEYGKLVERSKKFFGIEK